MPGRELPLDLRLLGQLRTVVRDDLLGAGVDPVTVDDAIVCMHEACANAMLYGKGRLRVHWEVVAQEVRFGVCDEGAGPSLPAPIQPAVLPATDLDGGRGLFLIGALASRLETRPHAGRHCLTFVLQRIATSLPATAPAVREAT